MALASDAPARVPIQRSAMRLCSVDMVRSGFVVPAAVGDLDHHAGALVEAEVVGRRHVEDAVRAVYLARRLERIAQRGAELRRSRLSLLERFGGGDGHQPAGIPGVGTEGRDRALAVRRFVLVDVVERAL